LRALPHCRGGIAGLVSLILLHTLLAEHGTKSF
jgi:hypothetical protein